MKSLITLSLLIFFSLTAISQKRVVKREYSKDCKKYMKKYTYENELNTKAFTLDKNLAYGEHKLVFSYKENRILLYLVIEDGTFVKLDYNKYTFNFKNDTITDLKLIDWSKLEQEASIITSEKTYYLIGFELSEDQLETFVTQSVLNFTTVDRRTNVIKTFEINASDQEYTSTCAKCFKESYLVEKKKYEATLKAYDKNFREFVWGDSMEKVRENETATFDKSMNSGRSETDDILNYGVYLNNEPYEAYYQFHNNKLYRGVYFYKKETTNDNKYYEKFKELSQILRKKYGEPKNITKHRSKDIFKDLDDIGLAISTGVYSEYHDWETLNSRISLEIYGDNYEVTLRLVYVTKDKELLKEVEVKREEKKTDGF